MIADSPSSSWRLPTTRIVCIVLTLMVAPSCCSDRHPRCPGRSSRIFSGPAGSAPNPAYWSYVSGTGWDRRSSKTTSPLALSSTGKATSSSRPSTTGNGYTSGRIQTKNKLSFGYGTITARIKMPSGQGLWPAFWLVGADEDTTPWPQCGEIDIIELVSNATTYYATLHGPISGGATASRRHPARPIQRAHRRPVHRLPRLLGDTGSPTASPSASTRKHWVRSHRSLCARRAMGVQPPDVRHSSTWRSAGGQHRERRPPPFR